MRDRPICQARAQSREFGNVPCFNYAKAERFGLRVCNVHKNLVDRLALGHGDEYALAVVWHEWRRKEAGLPRMRADVWDGTASEAVSADDADKGGGVLRGRTAAQTAADARRLA